MFIGWFNQREAVNTHFTMPNNNTDNDSNQPDEGELITEGSSSSFRGQRLLGNVAFSDIKESFDWGVRSDPCPPFVFVGNKAKHAKAMSSHRRRLEYLHRIPKDWGFAHVYVRWARERTYVHDLHTLMITEDLPRYEGVSADLLVYSGQFVWPSRRELSYMAAEVENRRRKAAGERELTREERDALDPDRSWTMPYWMRRDERKWRHSFNCLVPAQCCEIMFVNRDYVGRRYVSVPSGWWHLVEVPYGMRAELPPSVAYLSEILIHDPESPYWHIVRTEWAAEVAKDVLIQARAGRLCWISEASRSDIETIGVGTIFNESGGTVTADVSRLLRFIDEMRWSQCPSENRISVPDVTADITPVFESGDFFPFDPESWEVIAEDAMFIPRDDDGVLMEELDDHGPRRRGLTASLPSVHAPDGFSRGRDAEYLHPRSRGRRVSRRTTNTSPSSAGRGETTAGGSSYTAGPLVVATTNNAWDQALNSGSEGVRVNVPLTVGPTGIVVHTPTAETREIIPRDVVMTEANPSSSVQGAALAALQTVQEALAQLSGSSQSAGSSAEQRRDVLRQRLLDFLSQQDNNATSNSAAVVYSADGDRLTEDTEQYEEHTGDI